MQKKKILIVDDSPIAARQLKVIIDKANDFEIVGHAKNGIEAIKLYKELGPDIVTMDIVMPIMDGIQATRAILSMDKNAIILVVSSVGGVSSKTDEALKAGATSIITKPFDPDTITRQLETA